MSEVANLRHAPWTCVWGRFGGRVDVPPGSDRVDVFWTCLHPRLSPTPRLLHRGECETCPHWTPLAPERHQEG